jgi:hypothetical protein
MTVNIDIRNRLLRDGYLDEEIPAGINLIDEINRMKKEKNDCPMEGTKKLSAALFAEFNIDQHLLVRC